MHNEECDPPDAQYWDFRIGIDPATGKDKTAYAKVIRSPSGGYVIDYSGTWVDNV